MSWRTCRSTNERLRFIARLLEGAKMAALCHEFGISWATGAKGTELTRRSCPQWPVFERAFKKLGLPVAIRTHNGAPFASGNALFGLSIVQKDSMISAAQHGGSCKP
jgi:hypothetical protein